MPKVLITGITGFLGSHIAHTLIENGFEVIGLKRHTSDIWRCKDIESNIDWVNLDELSDWKTVILKKRPDIIIHSAWIGVEASERENWAMQAKNITFLIDILELSKICDIQKIIFLGSQAEYGNITGKISEEYIANSVTAYGAIKLACLEIYNTFCKLNNINWIWLRLFSVFGELENKNWLIPSLINKMQTSDRIELTAGEQKYSYMYVKDFASIINKIISNDVGSGVYNVSSNDVHQLKSLLEFIRNEVNPNFELQFGKMPYRLNQSMHIEGDMSKLISQIGNIEFTNFKVALHNTINHYILK